MFKWIKKDKTPKKGLIILLILSWIFSGYPQIGNFPPEVKKANALTATTTTYSATDISINSAQGQGEINNDGGSDILRRGFVVATGTSSLSDPGNTDPDTQTIYSLVYNDTATGTGVFDVLLFGLESGTDYRYRAFAQNSDGYSYGEDVGFTTESETLPEVSTLLPSAISMESVQGRGDIENDGGSDILRRGFVVATGTSSLSDPGNTDPDTQTIYSLVYNDTATGTGVFDVLLFGLESGTDYRYRAFAQNSIGYSYGEDKGFKTSLSTQAPSMIIEGGEGEFIRIEGAIRVESLDEGDTWTCGDNLTDDRDSEVYATLEIGDQCWFAEDLRYDDGCTGNIWNDTEPYNACDDAVDGSNDHGNLLYQWDAAMNGSEEEGAQGLCPVGWHIPSDTELSQLTTYVGANYSGGVGDQLKDSSVPSWCASSPCGETGWDALPGGYRSTDGSLNDVGSFGYWWSSSVDGGHAWDRRLLFYNSGVYRNSNSQALGFSVRCLRD